MGVSGVKESHFSAAKTGGVPNVSKQKIIAKQKNVRKCLLMIGGGAVYSVFKQKGACGPCTTDELFCCVSAVFLVVSSQPFRIHPTGLLSGCCPGVRGFRCSRLPATCAAVNWTTKRLELQGVAVGGACHLLIWPGLEAWSCLAAAQGCRPGFGRGGGGSQERTPGFGNGPHGLEGRSQQIGSQVRTPAQRAFGQRSGGPADWELRRGAQGNLCCFALRRFKRMSLSEERPGHILVDNLLFVKKTWPLNCRRLPSNRRWLPFKCRSILWPKYELDSGRSEFFFFYFNLKLSRGALLRVVCHPGLQVNCQRDGVRSVTLGVVTGLATWLRPKPSEPGGPRIVA